MPRQHGWEKGVFTMKGYRKRVKYIHNRRKKYDDRYYDMYVVEAYIPKEFIGKAIYVVVEEGGSNGAK